MNKQIEITEPVELLNAEGEPLRPGYAKKNIFIYNRDAVANKLRMKEWDFYQVSDGKKMIQVNFANIALGSAATATYIDMETGKKLSGAGICPFTVHRFVPPANSVKPHHFEFNKGGAHLVIDYDGEKRRVRYRDKHLEIYFSAVQEGDGESITAVFPFKTKGRFFYTDKINCMPAKGRVVYDGETVWEFGRDTAFAVLDWGRGCWPYSNYWIWANGSTRLENGKLFGFELTWGIGDESNATETMLFLDGKAHKIGAVRLEREPDGRWMEPWHFISEDSRFDMTMKPFYDNANPINLGLLKFSCHQVHGLWSGRAVLDDGSVIEVKDMYAFAEKMYNRW